MRLSSALSRKDVRLAESMVIIVMPCGSMPESPSAFPELPSHAVKAIIAAAARMRLAGFILFIAF